MRSKGSNPIHAYLEECPVEHSEAYFWLNKHPHGLQRVLAASPLGPKVQPKYDPFFKISNQLTKKENERSYNISCYHLYLGDRILIF